MIDSLPAFFNDGGFLPGDSGCEYLLKGKVGIGGYLTGDADDFCVDELPAYEPSGEGDHWYVRIRKRNMSSTQLRRLLANAAQIQERDIGMAGRKDADAITTQWMSLPVKPVQPDDDRVEFLDISRHKNKLKLGHLRGNRFAIRLYGVHEQAGEYIKPLLARLDQGIPNYFGPQRFGREGKGLLRSWNWFERKGGLRRSKKVDGRFSASVVQSALFNRWLGARLESGAFDHALDGDILKKRETGGLFHCTQPDIDQARLDSGEIDPTGPLFGPKMKRALSVAAERENEVETQCGLSTEGWSALARFANGSRRLARVVPTDFSYRFDSTQNTMLLTFELPPGSYATCVVAELAQNSSEIFSRFSST